MPSQIFLALPFSISRALSHSTAPWLWGKTIWAVVAQGKMEEGKADWAALEDILLGVIK